MAKSLFRCILIIAVLILIFGFATKGFSYALADAYDILIGNGWTVKDALGFLGTSIAGTIAMNPSLAPAVAAGALAAYIGVKGAQLYDIYREWRNLRTGIAILNPVEYSESMALKQLKKGEYGWSYMQVTVCSAGGNWYFYWEYREKWNDNGSLTWGYSRDDSFTLDRDRIIYQINLVLTDHVPRFGDAEGRAIFTTWLNSAYNYMLSGANFSATYSREVVPALDTGSVGVTAQTLGYRVNVDPQNISEDGANYLEDPDAFYNWFLTNYMNGTNEGTFVTPLDDAYDEIRSQLESIINLLNSLSVSGGVSEETLNQLKTDIINSITSVMNTSESDILNALDSEFAGLDSALTSLSNNVNSLRTDINTKFGDLDSALSSISDSIDSNLDTLESDISAVQTSIDTLSGEINETLQEGLEQERGLWDRLMEWLDETLFVKLRELLETLFLPTEEELEELFDIELPEYQKNFAANVSISSESVRIPISLFGASVDLSGYITQYASGLRTFINMFVSGLAAFFVIRAFRVHISID